MTEIEKLFKECDENAIKAVEEIIAENERINGELKDLRYNLDDWRNKADTMEARVKELEAELKQTEAQDQVVIDGLRKDNERLKKEFEQTEADNELQGKSLVAHSELITKFRKENAKLKCLALHAMAEYFSAMSTLNSWREDYYEESKYGDLSYRYNGLAIQYNDAHYKAKKKLREK